MQSQMSGVSAPTRSPVPASPAAPPAQPAHKPSVPRKGPWLWILLAAILVAGGFWYAANRNRTSTDRSTAVSVRTAAVTRGPFLHTIRITGTTGAERYAALMVPQLRGSRGDRGRDNTTGSTILATTAPPLVITSNANQTNRSGGSAGGQSSGSSAGAGTAGSSGTTDGSANVASTAGAASTTAAGSALQSATSRVNRGGAPTSSRSTGTNTARSGTGTNAANSTMGADGLGSTASELNGAVLAGGGSGGQGGGGGGGGGSGSAQSSEFGLILQQVYRPGARVKKGTVVGEFDRQYMLNRLDDYRASVEQTEASVKKLRAELDMIMEAHRVSISTSKADLDRARLDIKTIPVLSAMETERVRLALEEAEAQYKEVVSETKFVEAGHRAQIRNAEIELAQARLELNRAEVNADRMLVKAPIDGLTVMQTTFRGTEFGQIQAGDQLWPGMRFMQIVDASSMIINASVNQVDIERMRVGARANITFDAYPGLELPARVFAIGAMTRPGGARASFVREVPVVLKLEKMDPRVIPDLTVSADVVIDSEPDQTVVPLAAVFRDGDKGESYLLVKSGDAWERRPVQVGRMSFLHAVVESPLKPGEIVALERPTARPNGQT